MFLEFWELKGNHKIENIWESFRRCVIFEIDEVSYNVEFYSTALRDDICYTETHDNLYLYRIAIWSGKGSY